MYCWYIIFSGRQFSTSLTVRADENKDYEVNPTFVNRNPRNLEQMALARKRQGWVFQSPKKEYYNKLILETTNRHTTGKVVHWTGVTVVSASTKEAAIKQYLHSLSDVSAAQNIGSVLAQRCLEAGITNVFLDDQSDEQMTEKLQAFVTSMEEGCVELTEPDVIEPYYRPGIDYAGPHRIGGEAKDKPMKDDYQL